MTGASFVPLVWKEFRALSAAWLACVAAIVLAGTNSASLWQIGMLAYFIGAVALGALSVGHEYNLRTLTMILSQPLSRSRLYATKLAVLVPMVLTLALAAWALLLTGPRGYSTRIFEDTENWRLLALAAPAVCALFLAPAVTMLCRNPLAGIVFTMAAPCLLWFAADIVLMVRHGVAGSSVADTAGFRIEVVGWGLAGVCTAAAIASWPVFLRLEAIESRGVAVRLPSVARRERAILVKRRPSLALLAKELRLQQLTLVVTALYVVSWIATLSVREWTADFRTDVFFILTILHAGAVALLSGALASAEERQLGTSAWQTLLPMASWKQWIVKTGTAFGLTTLLGFGVPALLLSFRSELEADQLRAGLSTAVLITALVITTVSVYISTLCSSGLRALLLGLPVLLGLAAFLSIVNNPLSRTFGLRSGPSFLWPFRRLFRGYDSVLQYMGSRDVFLHYALPVLPLISLLGVLLLLLRFGLVNHRSAERGARRVVAQLGLVASTLAVGASLWIGGARIYRSGLERAFEQYECEVLLKNPEMHRELLLKNPQTRRCIPNS